MFIAKGTQVLQIFSPDFSYSASEQADEGFDLGPSSCLISVFYDDQEILVEQRFFYGSSRGPRRLSKAAKGKNNAESLDMDTEQDMVLDDMCLADFGSDWVLPSRLAKARSQVQ